MINSYLQVDITAFFLCIMLRVMGIEDFLGQKCDAEWDFFPIHISYIYVWLGCLDSSYNTIENELHIFVGMWKNKWEKYRIFISPCTSRVSLPLGNWMAAPNPPNLIGAELSSVAKSAHDGRMSRWMISFSWQ